MIARAVLPSVRVRQKWRQNTEETSKPNKIFRFSKIQSFIHSLIIKEALLPSTLCARAMISHQLLHMVVFPMFILFLSRRRGVQAFQQPSFSRLPISNVATSTKRQFHSSTFLQLNRFLFSTHVHK